MEPPSPSDPWPTEPTPPWADPATTPGPPDPVDPWSGAPALGGPAPNGPPTTWTAPSPAPPPGPPPAPPGWGGPPTGWAAPAPPPPTPPGWDPVGPAAVPTYALAPDGTWVAVAPPAPTSPAWMGFDPAQPPPRWGMPDILLGLLAWLLLQIVGLVALSLVTSDKAVLSIGGLAASWVGMVGYLVLVSRRKGFGSLRVDFGFRFRWFDPFLGFGIGLGTLFASGIVRIVIAQLFDEAPEGNAERIFGAVQDNKVALVVLALMAAIGAPLVEELFFRGLTLRAIERRLGGVAGVIGSSAVFAVLHFQGGTTASVLGLFLGILIYGLVFAVTTRLTRRLGPSVFAHMTINGLAAAVLIYSTFSGTPLGG